jgi:hypothetical protein
VPRVRLANVQRGGGAVILFNAAGTVYEQLQDGKARYTCQVCGGSWEGVPMAIGDGRFAIVAFVACGAECMTRALGIKVPQGTQ